MRHYREVIEEIRSKVNIVDVVGSYVSLRKQGKNYVGSCPFHTEKTPSFTVSDEKQLFHCFGCGASGSVFDFLMRLRNLTFSEAVEDLARRNGIPLPKPAETGQQRRMRELADRLSQANQTAARYFQRALLEEGSGELARGYLQGRNMGDQVIGDFELGYAPRSWDGLKAYLLGEGVSLEVAVQAGLLIKKSEREAYSRFRHRLMFPIKDMAGRYVGFGGRALDETPPKYLNSPESPVFHKGRILYGLATAKEACRQQREVILVEGYFDLLALYSRGIRNVVAPLGTALTGQHVRLLSRLAPQAVVVFDGDESGLKAAMRSVELFLKEKLPARMLALPREMDPDDFLRREGKEAFLRQLEEAGPLLDFFLEQCLTEYDGSVSGRLKVIRAASPVLRLVDSSVTREAYVRLLSQHLGVSEEVLCEELGWFRGVTSARVSEGRRDKGGRVPSMEEVIVRILIHYPQWIPALDEGEVIDHFEDRVWQKVASLLLKHCSADGNVDLAGLLLEVQDEGVRKAMTAWSLETSPWEEHIAQLRLQEYLDGIRARKGSRKDELKRLQHEIRAAEQSQNEELVQELLTRKAALLATRADGKANLSKRETL
ncbi:MAG: DNA primase [Syntrophobacteria bacterium]